MKKPMIQKYGTGSGIITHPLKEYIPGLSIQDLEEYFYFDNGHVTSTQTERLQKAFDFQIIAQKKVSMACQH